MKLTYKGKSAIVTGACGGMGLETTKKLLNNNRNYDPCISCDVNGLLNGKEFSESWKGVFASKEAPK